MSPKQLEAIENAAAVSRRAFLTSAAVSGAVAVLARPALAASQNSNNQSPNNQIVLGMIGVGGQGTGRLKEFLKHPDVRIAAICDVDERHADRAVEIVREARGTAPKKFGDFRQLLDVKEIDAVSIVTPDHWHAIPTVHAFEAGKDVFVEKPLSYSVAEGRAMADASLNHKRVTQMGNHIHNDLPNYRRVVELVRSGKLGKITRVHAWKASPPKPFTTDEPATLPAGFNYDFWLDQRRNARTIQCDRTSTFVTSGTTQEECSSTFGATFQMSSTGLSISKRR